MKRVKKMKISVNQLILLWCILEFNVIIVSCRQQISKKHTKVIVESSNNLGLSTCHDKFSYVFDPNLESDNETWQCNGFERERSISLLSRNTSFSIFPPSKNSTEIFYSKDGGSLTILIRQLTHPIIYLNFSYFLGKSNKTGDEVHLHHEASSQNLTKPIPVPFNHSLANDNSSITLTKESLTKLLIIAAAPNGNGRYAHLDPVLKELALDKNKPEVKEISEVQSIPQVDSNKTNLIPSIFGLRRKKRGASPFKNSTNKPNATITTPPEKNASSNVSTSPSPPTNVTMLTLHEAVEMIKTAAEAISKSAPAVSSPDTVGNSTGHMANSLLHETNQNETNTEKETNTHDDHDNTRSNKKNKIAPNLPNNERIHSDNRRNTKEARSTSKSRSKSGGRHGKGQKRRRKVENVERTEKKDDLGTNIEGGGGDDDDDSSSSSSSSEEMLKREGKGEKKISYKTWRASLEKRNRPPGLYVTVNDDIVFDNWDGIWDKHYAIGKWTGLKPLPNGKWNETHIWMNWEDLPVRSHDLKIIFEWVPISDNSFIYLSDIIISTIMMPAPPMSPLKTHAESVQSEESAPSATKIDLKNRVKEDSSEENATSELILVKHEDGTAWKIIKPVKSIKKPPETGNSRDNTTNSKPSNKTTQIPAIKNTTTTPEPDPVLPDKTPAHVSLSNRSNNAKQENGAGGSAERSKYTDWETASIVAILTGALIASIVFLMVKKRLDIARKGRNAVR